MTLRTLGTNVATLNASFAGALTATAVKTGAYTAAAGDLVPVDATSGAVTITLPTAPADRTRVAVKKIDSGANVVTVARGGSSDVFNKTGGSTTVTLSLQYQALSLQYSGGLWYVVADDLPLGQLDTRFTRRPLVNAKDYGATGDGTTNDTTALGSAYTAAAAAGLPLYIPTGTYKITSTLDWKGSYLRVAGDGPSKTIIRQDTDNIPILQTGGDFVNLDGFALQYGNIQTSANTLANCWEINDGYMGKYNDIQMYRGYRGLYQPQALWGARSQNCVFSSEFRNLEVNLFSQAGIDMTGYVGNNTGCVWSNLYLHNKEGSTYYSANYGARFKQTDEMDLRQINVEHGAYIQPLNIDTVRTFNGEALHFEDCRPGLVAAAAASTNGFITVSGDCKVNLNSVRLNLNVLDNTASAIPEYVILLVNGVGPDVEVNGLYEQNTTKTNSPTFRKVRADSSATTATVRIRKYTAGGASNADFDALSASRVRPLVRIDGDTQRHLVTATAALATNATSGFLYVPSCAGTPTGTPTTETGSNALVFDTTGNKLWIYTSGAWKGVVVA